MTVQKRTGRRRVRRRGTVPGRGSPNDRLQDSTVGRVSGVTVPEGRSLRGGRYVLVVVNPEFNFRGRQMEFGALCLP